MSNSSKFTAQLQLQFQLQLQQSRNENRNFTIRTRLLRMRIGIKPRVLKLYKLLTGLSELPHLSNLNTNRPFVNKHTTAQKFKNHK